MGRTLRLYFPPSVFIEPLLGQTEIILDIFIFDSYMFIA